MRKLLTAAAVCLMAAGVAPAQKYEIGVVGGISRPSRTILGSPAVTGGNDDDTRFRLSPGTGFGVRLTRNTKGYYGHELGFIRSRATLMTRSYAEDGTSTPVEDKVAIDQLFYNFLIYFMPAGERWRPFITGGIQGFRYQSPGVGNFLTTEWARTWGANYGGGIKLMPVRHILVRLDARQYLGGKPYNLQFSDISRGGGWLKQFEATAGFSITF